MNLIECFSVSSNVSLDPRLVCDENFNIIDIFEGRDTTPPAVAQDVVGRVAMPAASREKRGVGDFWPKDYFAPQIF